MVILLCLKWWYVSGWQWAWQRSVNQRTKDILISFSVIQLIQTWFAPFKQTYSDGSKGSIDVKINAFIDNFVSRIIGTIARTVLIVTGLVYVLIWFIIGLFIVVVWPFVPVLPIAGVVLALLGVTI
jgi:hypothetical protein